MSGRESVKVFSISISWSKNLAHWSLEAFLDVVCISCICSQYFSRLDLNSSHFSLYSFLPLFFLPDQSQVVGMAFSQGNIAM